MASYSDVNSTWFKFQLHWWEDMKNLTCEEKCNIMESICEYVKGTPEVQLPFMHGGDKAVWPMIKRSLDEDLQARLKRSKSLN